MKLLLFSQYWFFREGLLSFFNDEPGFDVIGDTSSEDELLDMAYELLDFAKGKIHIEKKGQNLGAFMKEMKRILSNLHEKRRKIANEIDLNIDKDGVSRPQGNDFDIGCYEFTNASGINEENNTITMKRK